MLCIIVLYVVQFIMKVLLLLVVATLYFQYGECAMSEAQLKAAMKLVRNVCQPKFKTTDEQIDAMHKGNWELEKSAKCYMWCILNMHKLISKENAFDWEAGIATLSVQAPESLKATAIPSIKNCKDAVKTPTDKCEAGYEIAHCIYLDNPEKYFLP